MRQEIVFEHPPLFEEIDRVFRVRGKPVIYAYGNRIFNPEQIDISPQLLAHEAIHGQRQMPNIVAWWRRYLVDPIFRLAEELPAHHAELGWLLENGNRKQRRAALKVTAERLADPLYGPMVTPANAARLLAEMKRPPVSLMH